MPIYLLRHLPTSLNENGQFMGQKDEPIMEGKKISYEGYDFSPSLIIFTSPLIRCLQTVSHLIEDHLVATKEECHFQVMPDKGLIERSMGAYEGRSKNEVRDMYPECYENGTIKPFVDLPTIEPFDDFVARVTSFYEKLLPYKDKPSQNVVVCSHGHVFRVINSIHYHLDIRSNWNNVQFLHGCFKRL